MKVLMLKKDTLAIGRHGVTGRLVDTGYLPAGTRVRYVTVYTSTEDDGLAGDTVTTFQASTDGGTTWYDHTAYERLATRRLA